MAALCLMVWGCQSFYNRQMAREWQALNDTIAECSQKIQNIVNTMQATNGTTEATQENLLHDLDSIQRHMKDAINRCAERNKDNELGRYIRENYTGEEQ